MGARLGEASGHQARPQDQAQCGAGPVRSACEGSVSVQGSRRPIQSVPTALPGQGLGSSHVSRCGGSHRHCAPRLHLLKALVSVLWGWALPRPPRFPQSCGLCLRKRVELAWLCPAWGPEQRPRSCGCCRPVRPFLGGRLRGRSGAGVLPPRSLIPSPCWAPSASSCSVLYSGRRVTVAWRGSVLFWLLLGDHYGA